MDINIELIAHTQRNAIRQGELKLLFSGKDCNEEFINAIGRILTKRVPMYAFPPELINIEKILPESGYIDSVPFNHDYMKLRLSQFPLINIDPGLSLLHEQYWKNVDYLDKDRKKHPNELNIEAFIDAKNDTNDIIHVTTNEMTTYVSGSNKNSDIKQIYDTEYPLLIISLRPKERFKCSMKAVMGIGLQHSRWNSASNYWCDQETYADKILLCFQSAFAMDEFVLLERALDNFKKTTMTYKDEIKRLYELEKTNNKRFKITLKNEDHTFGEVINYEFQSHPLIEKSGNTKPDHLIREVVIDVEAFEQEKLLPAMMESIDNLYNKITIVENKIQNFTKTKPVKEPEQKESTKIPEQKQSTKVQKKKAK